MSTTVIGMTFGDEVIAAGLAGLKISWLVGGPVEAVTSEDFTGEQQATLDQVIADHDPTKVPDWYTPPPPMP